jgi:hypothetical protein
MMDVSELDEAIERESGITLHRQQIVTGFVHVHPGPLLDQLFKITRPARHKVKAVASNHDALLKAAARILAGHTVKTTVIDRKRKLPADPNVPDHH